MTSYRYPNEYIILTITLLLVFGVIAVTAVATLCGSVLFVLVMLAISICNRSHHNDLIQRAHPVTPQTEPALSNLIGDCAARLQSGPVRTFVAPGNILNAYTFGLVEPQVVVVYAGLFGIMDADEFAFIIGHELGHVRLGHTWLNSLIGGIAGVPSPYLAAVVLYFAFRWWNRACRCRRPGRAVGLRKAGKSRLRPDQADQRFRPALRSVQGWQQALQQIEAEDDHLENNLREMLSTHPMTIRRLDALRQYATSPITFASRRRSTMFIQSDQVNKPTMPFSLPIIQTPIPSDFIDLGVGETALASLPVDNHRASELCFDQNDPAFLQYGLELGNGYFRQALAEFLSQGYGLPVDPATLLVTNGSSSGAAPGLQFIYPPG